MVHIFQCIFNILAHRHMSEELHCPQSVRRWIALEQVQREQKRRARSGELLGGIIWALHTTLPTPLAFQKVLYKSDSFL